MSDECDHILLYYKYKYITESKLILLIVSVNIDSERKWIENEKNW
jgi:hypothetical protein